MFSPSHKLPSKLPHLILMIKPVYWYHLHKEGNTVFLVKVYVQLPVPLNIFVDYDSIYKYAIFNAPTKIESPF